MSNLPAQSCVPAAERASAEPPVVAPDARRARPSWLTIAAVVALFIAVGHAWSLDTGLFLDDHAHFAHLREANWSFQGAVDASRLGIMGDVMDLWGRGEKGLRFFRPVAFWVMKLEYTAIGWRPAAMHGFSLGWHFACSMLVGFLAMRFFGHRFWAAVAACLMAIHPGHTATVYWIACQTELMTTAFLLASILAYSRYAGWGRPIFLRDSAAKNPRFGVPPRTGRWNALFGIVAVIFFALALGCRENAVLFPVVCWAGDWLCGSPRRRLLRPIHVAMFLVLGLYFALRYQALAGFPLPAKPYLMPISEPGFARYIVEKIVYYVIGLFGFVPVIPMSGQAYFASHPVSFYGGFAGTIAVLVIIWSAYRFRRALIWPTVWISLLIGPMLPVFASSHHLYLPSVGMVLLVTAGLAALGGLNRTQNFRARSDREDNAGNAQAVVATPSPRIPKPQLVLCGVVLLAHALGLSVFTWSQGFAYRAGTMTEDILIREVLQHGRPLHDGDDLYFINMSMLAYYAIPAIEAETGRQNLHGHVLTFSPWLLRMETPGQLDVLSPNHLRVRAPADAPYFEGVGGKSLLTVMKFDDLPHAGKPIRAEQFGYTVTPTVVDALGIRELDFTFDRSIDAPNQHVFFGSPQFWAYPVSSIPK
jgi:hypothetical protein